MIWDHTVIAAVISAIFAGVGLFLNYLALRENNTTRQLQLLNDSFKDIKDTEKLLYTDYKSKDKKEWDSLFFNSVEYFSFLVNENFIKNDKIASFYDDAIIMWYEEIFKKHYTKKERDKPDVFPEFKQLYHRIKENKKEQHITPNLVVKMSKKRITLTGYLEDNRTLIEMIGIFGALTAYFSTFSTPLGLSLDNFITYLVSFSSFSIFLLFCTELIINFPDREFENTTTTMKTFICLFAAFFFIVGFYFVFKFQAAIFLFSIFPLMIIYYNLLEKISRIFNSLFSIDKKFKKIDMLKKRMPLLITILQIIGFMLCFILALITTGLLVTLYINHQIGIWPSN